MHDDCNDDRTEQKKKFAADRITRWINFHGLENYENCKNLYMLYTMKICMHTYQTVVPWFSNNGTQ